MAVDLAQLGLEVRSDGVVVATNRLDNLEKQSKKTETATERLIKRTEKLGREMQKVGRALSLAVTLPLTAIATLSVRAFSQFDSAMTQSLAIMGDVSDAMRNEMSAAARQMAKETVFSASQAAESYFFLASAGLDAQQSISALPQVARFAQAGMFDMARATDLATDAQSALGLTVDDAQQNLVNLTQVTDVLVKANTVANASVSQFAESLTNKAGAAMRQLNIEVESGVAVLAAWADQGVKGTEAGEKFNIVTRDLQTAFRKNAEEFERFNIAVFDSEGGFRNMSDIIFDLEEALGELSVQEQGAALALLGFQDRSVSAIRSLIGLSGNIAEYESELRKASGTTEEVADKQMKSFSSQMGILGSRINDVAITIGEGLVPHVQALLLGADGLIAKIKGWADAFSEADESTQKWIIRITTITAALPLFIIALGVIISNLKTLIPLVRALATSGLGLPGLAIAAGVFIGTKLDKFVEGTERRYRGLTEAVNEANQVMKEFNVTLGNLDPENLIRLGQMRDVLLHSELADIEQEIMRFQVVSENMLNNFGSVSDGVQQKLIELNQERERLQKSIEINVQGMERERAKLAEMAETIGDVSDATSGLGGDGPSFGISQETTDALASVRAELQEIEASLGGPLAEAQLQFQRDWARMAEVLKAAGFSIAEINEILQPLQDRLSGISRDIERVFKNQKQALQAEITALKGGEQAWREYSRAQFIANQVAALGPKAKREDIESIQELAAELFDLREALDFKEEAERSSEAAKSAFEDLAASISPAVAAFQQFQRELEIIGEALKGGVIDEGRASFMRMALAADFTLRSLQGLAEQGSKEYKILGVAAQTLNTILGVQAILKTMSTLPWPANVAAGAQMAALIASLGVSIGGAFGGGGGAGRAANRQEIQGTGSVLGDFEADTESILKATEITADATSELVGISRGMLMALQALQSGIEGAVTLIARGGMPEFGQVSGTIAGGLISGSGLFGRIQDVIRGITNIGFGDPITDALIGLFTGKPKIRDEGIQILSGTIQDLIDGSLILAFQDIKVKSLFRSKNKELTEALSDEMNTQIGLIFQSIIDTVTAAAEALGILPADIQAKLDTFVIEAQKISLKDLSAEEQQAELEAVFSKIFDDLAGHVVPFIDQFQKVGEGLGETLVRVATSVQVFQEAVRRFGLAVDETDPEKFAQIAVGLIEATGGVEEFISKMQSFTDNFASDAQKFEIVQDQVTRAFEQMGITIPPTREAMFELLRSFDLTTEAGQQQAAALLGLGRAAETFFSMLEKATRDYEKATRDYAQTAAGLQESLALDPLSDFQREMVGIQRNLIQTIDALNESARAAGLQAAREEDLARAHEFAALQAVQALARLEQAGRQLATQIGITELGRINLQIEELRQAQSAVQWATGAAGDALRQLSDQLIAFADSLLIGDLSPLTSRDRLAEARRQLAEASAAGDAGAVQQLARQVLQIGESRFASGQRFTDLFDEVQDILRTTQAVDQTQDVNVVSAPGISGAMQTLLQEQSRLQAEEADRQRVLQANDLAQMVADFAHKSGLTFDEVAVKFGTTLAELGDILGLEGEGLDKFLEGLQVDTDGLAQFLEQLETSIVDAITRGFEMDGGRRRDLNAGPDYDPDPPRDRRRTTEAVEDTTDAVNNAADVIAGEIGSGNTTVTQLLQRIADTLESQPRNERSTA